MAPTTVLAMLFLAISSCLAQSREPDDSWLMKNYRFAGPPAPGEIQPVSPTVAQLQEVQNTVLSILRKADFAGDFETALAAAAQAASNAQLIGAVTGQLRPPPSVPARYLVALQDRTIEPAIAVWTDRLMLHYIAPEGAHVQVRLELVDWKRSAELNRRNEPCRSGN
ncbi:MAG TPA: hypothetical protein VMH28_32015 [Candidatus Acidoferrales bacterium]|nr:hypothetical protein [Candidatus Acidoferrales bacterium]